MKKRNQLIVMAAMVLALSGCTPPNERADTSQTPPRTATLETPAPAPLKPAPDAEKAATQAEHAYVLVMLGDSLTAGLGLKPEDAFPAVIARQMEARDAKAVEGHVIEVRNAGVSADTTANGLARFDWSVGPQANGVLIALGANDMLNGLDPAQTRQNLVAMIEKARKRRLDVYLTGMRASNNLGAQYAASFDEIYRDLAEEYCLPLFAFLLQPLANAKGDAIEHDFIQGDGLHPTKEGAALIGEALDHWLEIEMQSRHIPCDTP